LLLFRNISYVNNNGNQSHTVCGDGNCLLLLRGSLQVNRIVEYLMQCVVKSDFQSLQSFWVYLYRRFFSQMNSESLTIAYRLETNMLRSLWHVRIVWYCTKVTGALMQGLHSLLNTPS